MTTVGAALVKRIRAEMAKDGLEPDGGEIELLRLAEQLANRRAELERRIADDGVAVTLGSGRVVANPLVAESRLTAAALTATIAKIQTTRGPVKDAQRQKAAQSRWRAHNLAKQAARERPDGA